MSSAPNRSLPLEPMLAELTRRGRDLTGNPEATPTVFVARTWGPRSRQYRAVWRAIRAGRVTLAAAEKLCDDLDIHPVDLWGHDYYKPFLPGPDAERIP